MQVLLSKDQIATPLCERMNCHYFLDTHECPKLPNINLPLGKSECFKSKIYKIRIIYHIIKMVLTS